jgi:hypothetical protein
MRRSTITWFLDARLGGKRARAKIATCQLTIAAAAKREIIGGVAVEHLASC